MENKTNLEIFLSDIDANLKEFDDFFDEHTQYWKKAVFRELLLKYLEQKEE